jgi:hypothetical protein
VSQAIGGSAVCHECGRPAMDTCVRCELPTCADHFHEREHLGLCTHCGAEIEAGLARGGAMTGWPYPLRKPFNPVDTTES